MENQELPLKEEILEGNIEGVKKCKQTTSLEEE